MTKRRQVCPVCGSRKTGRIQYGEPTPETLELVRLGKLRDVVFGGCCITEDQPEWCCRSCDHEWATGGVSAEAEPVRPIASKARVSLPYLDEHDFDRALVLRLGETGCELATRELAGWTATAIREVLPERRRGTAYLQLGKPTGNDDLPLRDNMFLPSGAMTLCLTGSPELVGSIALAVTQVAGPAWARGARHFDHQMPLLPFCTFIDDGRIVMSTSGPLSFCIGALREAQWTVRALRPESFDVDVARRVGTLLGRLPSKAPRAVRSAKASRLAKSTKATQDLIRRVRARMKAQPH